MQKQASLNGIQYAGAVITALVEFLDKNAYASAVKDAKSKGYEVLGKDAGKQTLELKFNVGEDKSGSAKSIANEKLKELFPPMEVSTKDGKGVKNVKQFDTKTVSADFVFKLDYDYSGTDGINVQTILEKVDPDSETFERFRETKNAESGGYSRYVTVKSDTPERAENELGRVLANTTTFTSGQKHRMEVAPELAEYLGKSPEGSRLHLDTASRRAYFTYAHKKYVQGLKDALNTGVQTMQGFYSFLDDVTDNNVQKLVDKSLLPGLNSLSLASWFKFRAERIERAARAEAAKNLITVDDIKSELPGTREQNFEEFTKELSAASKSDADANTVFNKYLTPEGKAKVDTYFEERFGEQDTVADTVAELNERYSEDKPLHTQSRNLISAVNAARGVSEKGAKELPDEVKVIVNSQIREALPEDSPLIAKLSGEVTDFENPNAHQEKDIGSYAQEHKGESPYSEQMDRELTYMEKVNTGEIPAFMEIPLEHIEDPEQRTKQANKYKKELAELKAALERVRKHVSDEKLKTLALVDDTSSVLPTERDEYNLFVAPFKKLLAEQFNGETVKRVLENLPTWEKYVEDNSKADQNAKPKENRFVKSVLEDEQFADRASALRMSKADFDKLSEDEQSDIIDELTGLQYSFSQEVKGLLGGGTYRELSADKSRVSDRNKVAKFIAYNKEVENKLKELLGKQAGSFKEYTSSGEAVVNRVLKDAYAAANSTTPDSAELSEAKENINKVIDVLSSRELTEEQEKLLSRLEDALDFVDEVMDDLEEDASIPADRENLEGDTPQDTKTDFGELHNVEEK